MQSRIQEEKIHLKNEKTSISSDCSILRYEKPIDQIYTTPHAPVHEIRRSEFKKWEFFKNLKIIRNPKIQLKQKSSSRGKSKMEKGKFFLENFPQKTPYKRRKNEQISFFS